MDGLLQKMTELRAWADLIGIIVGGTIFVVFVVLVLWIKLSERLRKK